MDKVIVERPRRDPFPTRRGRAPKNPENLPFRAGIKKTDWGKFVASKVLNENLPPLRRFLEGQVGRPWDKVFSELNANLKPGNTVQEHVLTHVDDFIARRVALVPASPRFPCGLAQIRQRWGGRHAIRPGDLYVGPQDGIVKVARRRYFDRQTAPEVTVRRINSSETAVKVDGVWYAVEVRPVRVEIRQTSMPDPLAPDRMLARKLALFTNLAPPSETLEDVLLGRVSAANAQALRERYSADVYGVAKRQLSGRELRNLALVND
jgi:hypothetical protein